MSRIAASVLALTLVLFAGVPFASAQSNGSIKGVVKDPSGAILPGATVVLVNKATQQSVQTITAEAGTYTFAFLTPGDYSLTVEMPGFKKYLRDNLTVNVAQVYQIDAVLSVGEVSSEISVSAETPIIQTQSAELGEV